MALSTSSNFSKSSLGAGEGAAEGADRANARTEAGAAALAAGPLLLLRDINGVAGAARFNETINFVSFIQCQAQLLKQIEKMFFMQICFFELFFVVAKFLCVRESMCMRLCARARACH